MPAGRCAITRLRLYQFRNYPAATVTLGPAVNVIAGANAQGKTNLLEAAATLALTRSPRTSTPGDLLMWGRSGCAIEGAVARPAGDTTIAIRLERNGESARVSRTATVDGKPRPARSLLGLCPVVTFWPDDLQLVKVGPEARRRLLDVLLMQLDPRIAAHMSRYRRVLEQRNALLHRMRAEGRGGCELDSFTKELAHHGARIAVGRTQLVRELAPLANAALRDLSGGHEDLALAYVTAHQGHCDDEDQAERDLLGAYRVRAAEELARGASVVGPHRDDMSIQLAGRPARTTASQGQQRSIVLAIKLAEMRHLAECTGASPVVMLDDVLSELDQTRRGLLLSRLAGPDAAQVLITTTEPLHNTPEMRDAQHFTVVRGSVVPRS